LSIQHGGVDVEKDSGGAYKVTYDDTKAVTAKITFKTSGVTTTNCPVVFYYKGTGTYGNPATNNTYGSATDADFPDNSGTDDKNNPRNLGNSNGPKEAGTYRATVIIDPTKTSGYELDSSCSQTITFTIEPKTVNLPTAGPTSGLTYNGNDQTISYVYDAKAVKEITSADTANFTSLSEVVSGTTKNYKDLTFDSTATSGTNKTTKFTAKKAGDYGVKFELSSTRNYKWNVTDTTKEYQPQIVSYTIKQVTLTITLAPPSGQNSFTWGLGVKGNITVKNLTGVLQSDGTNDDPVTFNVSYYLKPATGSPSTPGVEYSDKAYGDIEFDVSKFTATGTYILWIQLADDSAGDDVNCNYTFAGTDTNFNPVVKDVFVQSITVGSGSVDVSGLKWGWSQDGSIPVEIDSTTKLIYTYDKTASAAKDFTVTLLDGANGTTSSLPAYLQVQSFNSNGFTNGYKDNEKSDVNFDVMTQTVVSYKAVVRLEIIDDSNKYRDNYKFTAGNTAYTRISDYEAEVEFRWTILPQEIDFSDVEWQFADTLIGEKDTAAKWTKYDTTAVGGQPEYTGNYIFVKINETLFTDLGLTYTYDSSDANNKDLFINYNNKNKQRDAVDSNGNPITKNSVATITLNNHNFTLPSSSNPHQETLNWRVLKKQIYISGWTGTRAIVGSDGAGGTKAFTFPMPNVTRRGTTDTTDYNEMFEYVFDYTLPVVGSLAGKTEAEMIADVYPVATPSVPVDGTVYVKLKDSYAKDYEINVNSPMSATFSVGDSKIVITMSFGGTHKTYGDGGDFTIIASEEGVDKTATLGNGIKVTATDAAGQVNSFNLSDIANSGILEFLKNAGTYKFEFELATQYTGTYALYVSELDYTVARKEIVVPQVIKALTFNGNDLVFTDHLDNQYTANLSLIEVTGDTLGRNVISGGYQVTLALNDENYCWVLPASTASSTKSSVKITLAEDTVETSVELSSDAVRAVYSWNVAPLTIDSSKMWKDGQLKLPPELATLVNNGDVSIKYNYYDTDGILVGDSESGFEPQGGVSYRIEAVLGGQDGENGNVVFVSSDGSISGDTSEQVVYTAPKTGMAKFKDTLTKKYMGMPLWLWLVIGLCVLLFLIILICIIVAAAKKKKKKKEEEAAQAEKEEAKAAAAAAAAAPMLAMSASMADEKAKLEA
ncbi:MAG: hypothetical protein K2N33_01025, partial [Clostridia bacterium]|nr:hypothetical protein [Clostridia bacterium]